MAIGQQLYYIIKKQYKKLNEKECNLLKKWCEQIPYFSKLKQENQYMFQNIIKLFEVVTVDASNIMNFADEQSIEYLYVLKGSIEVERKKYFVDKNVSKKRRKLKLDYTVQSLGTNAEGTELNWVGQSYIKACDKQAEIFVITKRAYDKVVSDWQNQKNQEKINILLRHAIFCDLDKRNLRQLAQNSDYRQFYLNNFIFKHNEEVGPCYILLQGSIKLEKQEIGTKSSNKTSLIEMSIISPEQVFGEQQLLFKMSKRYCSALCMTEKLKVLEINSQAFIKAMDNFFKNNESETIKAYENKRADIRRRLFENSAHLKKLSSTMDQDLLPKIKESKLFQPRKYSYGTTPAINKSMNNSRIFSSEQNQEYKLIKNSHQLLQSKTLKNNQVVRSQKSQTINPFDQKIKLYNKLITNLPKLTNFGL